MKAVAVVAIIASVGALAGYVIYSKVTNKMAKDRRDKFQRDFFAGKLPPIPGPYLGSGNVRDLKFKVVDLGSKRVEVMSEDGHLLLWTNKGDDNDTNDYELLGPDLKLIKRYKNALTVTMTPTGTCYAFRTDQPNGVNATIEMPDGSYRPVPKGATMEFAWRFGHLNKLGTEAFIFLDENITKHDKPFEYFDLNLTKRTAEIKESLTYIEAAHSSGLGDICRGFEETLGGHNTFNLAFFKDGIVKAEDIPIPHEKFDVVASKDKIAVTAGSDFFERIPFLRTGKSQYERIGVLKGALSAEVSAMNSHGEYLMSFELPNHSRPSGVFQMDTFGCFVSGEKYYFLPDIIKEYFPKSKVKMEISPATMDERGDLVVTGGGKSYLLQRQ